jgi:mannose-6-phosphate isomerase-like protein (cupin superfamily)
MRLLLPSILLLVASDQAGSADSAVKYLSASDVAKAIREAPAGPIAAVPLATGAEYRVLGIRRGASGEAELHEKEIDVWYVLEGQGSLVTGGTLADPKNTAPGEVRGSGIRGGETRAVGKGDLVTIAAGVPHWMSKVDAPMQYLVIKVTAKP